MQIGEWLGFIINTISMQFQVPIKKLTKIKCLLDANIQARRATFRQLAKIAGSIISFSVSRLFTRQMYFTIESRSGAWDQTILLPLAVIEELKFWFTSLDQVNGYTIRPPLSTSTIIFTDASDVAFGGYSASLDGSAVRGMWTNEDIGQSSTYHELKAIYYVLLTLASQLMVKKVVVQTDNQGAARIVSIGSSKPHLQRIALDLYQVCLANQIVLSAQWITRSLNDRADALSRFVDTDDWSIHPYVFRVVDARWGPHTIDRFASHYNT
ncbi:hypothetical protein QZH41_002389 [Actinostola sp. cb2023]|nr:hypothetical protein QZH41_002389 [Actinostola sp. cb2023]